MVYQRTGRDAWFVAVPTSTGRVKRSTGTSHRATARAIERMLIELGPQGQRAWDLLDRVADDSLSLGALFDAFRHNDLAGLRERLGDVDVEMHINGWRAWLGDRVRPDTATHYLVQLRTLIPEGKPYPRSQFTAASVAKWLATRTALVQKRKPSEVAPSRRKANAPPRVVTGATKRKYRSAAQSFAAYLIEIGVLASNPVRDVKAPKQNRPRAVAIDLRDVRRIVSSAEPSFRALFVLLYGAGVEISAALDCVDHDVDVRRREVRARGTKAHTRDRVVRVADWAWPYLEAHLATLMPGERLFRGIHRWRAGDVHRQRLVALGLPHHRLHDARHFYAVRAVRAGTPYELVARQLGHADVQMVATIYGRYAPRSDERDRWERIASTQDAEEEAERTQNAESRAKSLHEPRQIAEQLGTSVGTTPPNDSSQPPVSDWLANSRGGTRTRDPGIMSAVL